MEQTYDNVCFLRSKWSLGKLEYISWLLMPLKSLEVLSLASEESAFPLKHKNE